ncbi:MAG: hypothetical protein HC897_05815 [Thermoanaerobaculia bacterium]|nr:hypothetical protein [Thermoanaerobaculia bacterium]
MRTIETIATVSADGLITARGPESLPRGQHRAVIVLDELPAAPRQTRRLPDMAAFRASLGAVPHPGNSVVEMRRVERP